MLNCDPSELTDVERDAYPARFKEDGPIHRADFYAATVWAVGVLRAKGMSPKEITGALTTLAMLGPEGRYQTVDLIRDHQAARLKTHRREKPAIHNAAMPNSVMVVGSPTTCVVVSSTGEPMETGGPDAYVHSPLVKVMLLLNVFSKEKSRTWKEPMDGEKSMVIPFAPPVAKPVPPVGGLNIVMSEIVPPAPPNVASKSSAGAPVLKKTTCVRYVLPA
jgi:hypothetical protein